MTKIQYSRKAIIDKIVRYWGYCRWTEKKAIWKGDFTRTADNSLLVMNNHYGDNGETSYSGFYNLS